MQDETIQCRQKSKPLNAKFPTDPKIAFVRADPLRTLPTVPPWLQAKQQVRLEVTFAGVWPMLGQTAGRFRRHREQRRCRRSKSWLFPFAEFTHPFIRSTSRASAQFPSVAEHRHGSWGCGVFGDHSELMIGYESELHTLPRQKVHCLAERGRNGNLASFSECCFIHGEEGYHVIMSCQVRHKYMITPCYSTTLEASAYPIKFNWLRSLHRLSSQPYVADPWPTTIRGIGVNSMRYSPPKKRAWPTS